MKKIVLILIRGYQMLISPWIGPHCRFEPTCSNYAAEAVRSKGIVRGAFMSVRRLLKCQPFNAGGFDPVG